MPGIQRPHTVAEAADRLNVSVYTIRAWLAQRRLGYVRLGRAIRIPDEEIRRLVDDGAVPARQKRGCRR